MILRRNSDLDDDRYRNSHRWFAGLIFLVIVYQLYALYEQQHPQGGGIRFRQTIGRYNERREQGRGLIDIDLNSADEHELTLLPNVGPVLAKRIIRYRSKHGKFHDIADLLAVSGVGAKTVQSLQGLAVITVEPGGKESLVTGCE